MATPDPNDFQNNDRNPVTLSQFIRMKRVLRRGRKKHKLGIKKLINRLENKLTSGEQVQAGSVLAVPSAPSYTEDDNDEDSWGSDFDDDENTEDISWDCGEEMQNDINDMLEAAMERKKNLQNSNIPSGGNVASQELPSRSDANLVPQSLDLSARPNVPPLPPRNLVAASSAPPVIRNLENKTSAPNSIPGRSISKTSVNRPLPSTSKTPTSPQTNSAIPGKTRASPQTNSAIPGKTRASPQASRATPVITPPMSHMTSASGIGHTAQGTPPCNIRSELPSSFHTTSQQATRAFPPDVTKISNCPSAFSSPLFLTKKDQATKSTPPLQERVANRGDSNAQVENPQRAKLSRPEIAAPPPLPSRPPPVRRPLNNSPIKSTPSHPAASSSTSKERNDASTFNIHPGQALPNSVAKLQITKGASSSLTSLTENALQNSSVSKSSKPVFSTGENLPARDRVRIPEKPDPKRKSIALGVPKILKELDAAVLKQVTPKRREKASSIGQLEHSLDEKRSSSSSENSAKAEDTNSPSDDYLNPKELKEEGQRFVPDRPTLPRRLKHARSLPLLNIVDSLMKDSSKNKATADEDSRPKLCLQTSQAASEKSENGQEHPAAIDEITRQPWYHPVTWPQAQLKLITMSLDGAFLVRPSSKISEGVPFTVSVFFRGRIINCYICSTSERKYVLGKPKPNQKTFDTIMELIRFYQSTPAELKISDAEPAAHVRLLITPPKDITDKIYADA